MRPDEMRKGQCVVWRRVNVGALNEEGLVLVYGAVHERYRRGCKRIVDE